MTITQPIVQRDMPFEERVSEDETLMQTPPDTARPFDAELHEIIDAIAAIVMGAQAGSRWLRVQPPDLEEVREILSSIAVDGKRACELVVRLRAVLSAGAQTTQGTSKGVFCGSHDPS
ncbi:hypothetical protein Q2941_30170 [Bradyrhizobium sp. UFLA05-153]|uniref:hypothetical protein n=1 Tax=Bradyrhizobium sp. Ec3.3 TaxID=189753 RepID=UPI0004800628|nr:hypothetical protein [Bradyrhizobium sp. Ec3.3]